MNIYIARHGETEYNKQKRYQGSIDIPLNEAGRNQARNVSKELDVSFDVVISSPLIRALETAEILSGFDRKDIIIDERIREICMGVYEGQYYAETDKDFEKFFKKPEEYVAVNGSESFESLKERMWDFLCDITGRYKDTDKKILILSHGAAIHALLAVIKDIPMCDFWKIPVENCRMIRIGYDNNRYEVIE